MSEEVYSGIYGFEHVQEESPIIDLLRSSGKFTVEELAARVPNLSWSQIFLAIDMLSRSGHVILRREGSTYTLEMAKPSPVLAGDSHGTTDSDHR